MREQAELLSQLTRALAGLSTDKRVVIPAIVTEAARAMDAYCRFLVVSTDGQWLQTQATAVPPSRSMSDEARKLFEHATRLDGESAAARVVRQQMTMRVPEVTEAQIRATFSDPAAQAMVLALAPKSAVLVPVVGDGGLHGVLSLVRAGTDAVPFDDDEIWFAEQLAAHAALAMTNANLIDAARTRAEQLQLVSDLTRDVAHAAGNFQQLLEVVVRRLGGAMGDFCIILLVRPDGSGFDEGGAVYSRDPDLEPIHRRLLRELGAGPHPLFPGALDGSAMRVTHVELPALLASVPAPVLPLVERIAPTTYMAVPLKLKGPPIAVLLLGRGTSGLPFTADEQHVVEDLAIHAAIAMTNTRLIENAERTAERLRVLTSVAAELDARFEDSRAILEQVGRTLSELVGDACVVQLVSEDGETIEPFKAVVHRDPEVVARVRARLGEDPRKAEGVTRRVLGGEAVSLSGEGVGAVAELAGLGVQRMLSLPMRVGSQTIGTATLMRMEGAPYTDADRQYAQDLLTHAALAIRNSRLLTSVQHELAERARAEQALRESEEQLRHAQKMEAVGRLAGGVAHDFNNLLTVVLHSCGFITEALPQQSPILEDVEQIRHAGERAAKLTRQLLAFSRQQVLNPEVLDLGTHVRNMDSLLRRLMGERCILVFRGVPDLGKVRADATHIEQIVMNLAINARDAMPLGGTLTIETSNATHDELRADGHVGAKPGRYVMLAISDTGEGMSKETQQRIFEPFFTTKPVGKGTGLGLSTVFGIVEQNGGTISTHSELAKGTTFKIYLPCTDEGIALADPPPVEDVPRGGETILLVEDDDAVRRAVVRALTRKGYRVIETRNGLEALSIYGTRTADIDLVLIDVMMPVMGGGELAKRLLAKAPDLPVLFMSGYIDDSIIEAGIEPETLISKPLNLEALMRKIRARVDGRHS